MPQSETRLRAAAQAAGQAALAPRTLFASALASLITLLALYAQARHDEQRPA